MVQEKDVGYFIKNINDKMKARADADLKRDGLTLAQSRVLVFLYDKGGAATQKEIERFLEVSHPTVAGIVSRMEQNGHVVCWMDARDKRIKNVELTELGAALGKDVRQKIRSNEAKMLDALSGEEIAQLKRLLQLIWSNLEQLGD